MTKSLKELPPSDITTRINEIGIAGKTGVSHIEEKFLLGKNLQGTGIDNISDNDIFHNLFREDKHHDEVSVLESKVIKDANHEDDLIRQGSVVPEVLKTCKVVDHTIMLNSLNNQHTFNQGDNNNLPSDTYLCLVKDVFDKVKCIPGINSCIDPAGHTHEGYIEHIGLPKKVGNILKKKNTINHIIENGGFLEYPDTSPFNDPTKNTHVDLKTSVNKKVAHLFTAYFNYDVLIFYEIMKQIGVTKDEGKTIHRDIFSSDPIET